MTTEKIWKTKNADPKKVSDLAESISVSKTIATLLVLRGISTYDDAKAFFRPNIEDLHDPFLMKGMNKAIQRIQRAIKKNDKILIYGDYDVDGTTSVAMCYQFFSVLSTNIEYYIPCRYSEGYGISYKAIDYAHEKNVSLIIALDCGIRAIDQVNYANKKFIDFIICDHHTTGPILPNAYAILNPKQKECKYPFSDLSACGVGFKLIHAYSIKYHINFSIVKEYLDLVALSIAADIVPINRENRILAFHGLKKINMNPTTGVRALVNLLKIKKQLNITDVIFGIAPRINAAGRILHAKKAVEILVEKNYDKAEALSKNIEKNNNLRKEIEKEITNEAINLIDKSKNTNVVLDSNWHKGVIGIVASKLIDFHHRPTIVFSENNGLLTGSARSVNDFDLYSVLLKCSHLFDKFGGHKYAAGITMSKKNLKKFSTLIEQEVSKTIKEDHKVQILNSDVEIDINTIDDRLYRIISQFSPFGPSNKKPIFISKKLQCESNPRLVGSKNAHLILNLKQGRDKIKAIGFNMANKFTNIKHSKFFDICYYIEQNEWNGMKKLQLRLLDIRMSK